MSLRELETPAALIDQSRMVRNIERMQKHLTRLGVAFRPHVKTSKCVQVWKAQAAAGASGITVSTLQEAEQFFAAGEQDILYSVSIVPSKLERALALRRKGCDLKLIVDNVESAKAVAEFGRTHGETFEVWIEIDTDGHRSGIQPKDSLLLSVGRALHENGVRLGGVMTHAGSSYELNTPEALAAMAEQERSGCVRAAQRLRDAGLPCDTVSVGSTPTALAAQRLDGVTEVRAGVYVFFDLVMHNVGVCKIDDIALSVLTTVIGHQIEKRWAIVDAGWMAMSRDRGTSKQSRDYGYGQVCALDGTVMAGYQMIGANQEHGIVALAEEACVDAAGQCDIAERFPIGTKLRILPNHACATGAQYPVYQTQHANGEITGWPRSYGW
jgi:D-serine deaminase-like pyridoxal phosphate-dependent protein